MRPLREGEGPAASLLRAAATALPEDPAARVRVGQRLFARKQPSAARLLLAGAIAAAAGVALASWVLRAPEHGGLADARAGSGFPGADPKGSAQPPGDAVARNAPGATPQATAEGEGAAVAQGVMLPEAASPGSRAALRPLAARESLSGTTFALTPGAEALLMTDRSVALGRGALDVVATSAVQLALGRQRVFAERASFRVSVSPAGDTAVLVFEGAVEVRGPQGTARVTPEAPWAQGEGVDPAELLHREALGLEREGQLPRALQVLVAVVPHPGAWGELSLYDAARLELARGERARATALLAQHHARFPRGSLTVEVGALEARLRTPAQKP